MVLGNTFQHPLLRNKQAALGRIGAAPTFDNQPIQFILTAEGRLNKAQEFGDVVIKTKDDGTLIFLKDVSTIELGAETYDWNALLNKKPTALIGIYQLPGSNSLAIKKKVVMAMKKLKGRFPDGLEYKIPYDTTLFVDVAIKNVVRNLLIAVALVILIVFLFLGSWRPTIIASVAIPVSLIGTFGILQLAGFSINFLTLFGLILAIGIVVDDVILVVENVERLMYKHPDLTIPQVVKKSMLQLIGPVIATTLVLVAVFVPVSMMPGLVGSIYKQFSLTICFAVIISSINALTLSPALSAIIIKRLGPGERKFVLFRLFDRLLDRLTSGYMVIVRFLIKIRYIVLLIFCGLLAATYWIFTITPSGFVPEEDKGVCMVMYNLKPGTAIGRTSQLRKKLEKIILAVPGVENMIAVDGYNLLSQTMDSSAGTGFISFKHWNDRTDTAQSGASIIKNINMQAAKFSDARIAAFNVPGIPGLGNVGGFDFRLQDYLAGDINTFVGYADKLIVKADKDPRIATAYTSYAPNYPMLAIDIDRKKVNSLGVDMAELFATMQTYSGSFYVNDFSKYGKVFRVFVQADKQFRSDPSDISKLFVRNKNSDMVPLNALVTVNFMTAPQDLPHYNLYRAITINGSAAPGYSSGQAMAAMEELAEEILPDDGSFGYDWSGMSYQEKLAGNTKILVFGFAIIVVYLVLCAQYESWILPIMILVSVPLVMLGALTLQNIAGLDNNLFAQVGLVLLIGLSCKNAILIVEVAKEQRESGVPIIESALNAAKLRFRAIMMTILSFVFGVIPLAVASGAGAMTMRSIGTIVLGGMVAATFISTMLVPVIFVLLESLRERFINIEEVVKKRELL